MSQWWHLVQDDSDYCTDFVVIFHDGHRLGPTADGVILQIEQWCITSFGDPQYGGRWWERDDRFRFRDRGDAALFKLRWGGT